ncbi:MAG TPA: hypothetical protein VGN73_02640 [Gemmatimonadaceae bacterium]|nr:hypothetical protein [Gemmatimonadaceae bacterium]
MPRAYTVATAALALGTSPKWIDNALSHHTVGGLTQGRQGVPRRLSIDALLVLSITLMLVGELGTTLGPAIRIAEEIAKADGFFRSAVGLSIELDLNALRIRLLSRLEEAVEVAPLPRRGRPPKNTTGRLE